MKKYTKLFLSASMRVSSGILWCCSAWAFTYFIKDTLEILANTRFQTTIGKKAISFMHMSISSVVLSLSFWLGSGDM